MFLSLYLSLPLSLKNKILKKLLFKLLQHLGQKDQSVYGEECEGYTEIVVKIDSQELNWWWLQLNSPYLCAMWDAILDDSNHS